MLCKVQMQCTHKYPETTLPKCNNLPLMRKARLSEEDNDLILPLSAKKCSS